MAKKVEIYGAIIGNDAKWIYDWFDMDATCPREVIKTLSEGEPTDDAEVFISSGGGDIFSASEIYSALKSYAGRVTVKITGLAASAASVIAMAGDKVIMAPTAQLMIHNVSTWGCGDYNDFEHIAEELKQANKAISEAYRLKTNKTQEELLELMNRETWFTAADALGHGFIDEIMFASETTPTLVANASGGMIPSAVITKMMSMKSKLNSPKPHEDEGDFLMRQKAAMLNLLKLKGVVL